MLNTLGWEKGWNLLNGLAGNTRKFTHSSSDPIKAVLTGDAAVATAINFYAVPKIASLGKENLGFVLPANATIFNSDPVAILKGAPHRVVAERFVDFVLSEQAQKILIYPKGHEKGPKYNTLGRIAVIPKVYKEKSAIELDLVNPFDDGDSSLNMDMTDIVETKKIISEMIGTIHVDLHGILGETWRALIKKPSPELKTYFLKPLISKNEMEECKKSWKDPLFRTKKKNEWMKRAKKKYETILEKIDSSHQKHKSWTMKAWISSLF